MRGINKVILVGQIGKNPETKTFVNGGSLTQFSIATSESWVDKNTGQRKEQTEWHRIVFSNRLGEIAQQYLHKGSKVYIEGSLRTRQWTDQNGQQRYSTEIRGDKLEFIESYTQDNQNTSSNNYFNQQQAVTYTKPKNHSYTHNDRDDYLHNFDNYEHNGEKICGVCDTPISGDECYNCEIGD